MKKHKLSKLALLGIASGLVAGQTGLEAMPDANSIDIQHLIAKPKCAEHGCGGLTAERDVPPTDEKADEIKDDSTESVPTDDKKYQIKVNKAPAKANA